MRCLYCGKELALFKRLRGGEFCSDAHRQQYQEEYTQLALNRLLQANAAKDGEKDGKSKELNEKPAKSAAVEPDSPALKRREKLREEAPAAAPPPPIEPLPPAPEPVAQSYAIPQQTAVVEAQPPMPAAAAVVEEIPQAGPEPEAASSRDEPPPAAMRSFIVEFPAAPAATAPEPSGRATQFLTATAPALPRLFDVQPDPDLAHLDRAGRVRLSLFTLADFQTPPRERGLELREFVRGVPPVEIQVKPAVESGFAAVQEALDVELEALPPAATATLWTAPQIELAREHEVLLGDLARLDFALTVWGEGNASGDSVVRAESAPSEPPASVEAAIEEPVIAPAPVMGPARMEPMRPEPNKPEPARPEPARMEPLGYQPAASPQSRPAPLRFEPVQIDPMFLDQIAGRAMGSEELGSKEAGPVLVAEEPPAAPPELEEQETPPNVTKPLPVTLHGLAPVRGKPVQVFTTAAVRPGDLQIPRATGLPLRPVMVLGPAPKPARTVAPSPKPVPAAEKPVLVEKAVPVKPQPKPEAPKAEVVKQEAPKPESPKPESTRPEASKPQVKPEPAPPVAKTEAKAEPKPEPKPAEPAAKPVEKPKSAEAPKFAEAAKIAEPPKTAATQKIDEAQKTTDAQKTAEAQKTGHAAKTPAAEIESLGLPTLALEAKETFWSKLPAAVKLGGIAAVLALVVGGIVLTSRGSGSSKPAAAAPVEPVYIEQPALANTAGWEQDWFADRPGSAKSRHVDVLKGSLTERDYRLVFEGEVESGALGWVFRAADKSFYVEKIQTITPGREPVMALVHFAVINGQEQARSQTPLPIQAHLDTVYKVRMDIIGDRFTTWVQDQKIDQWSDSQLAAGGVGLYYENGDSAKLRDTLNVVPLRRK